MSDQVSALRRANTPVDHLIAETAAMPLATRASLELSVYELEPHLPDQVGPVGDRFRVQGHVTGELWRRVESELLRAFPAVALEELVAVRDMLWFQGGPNTSPSLGEYLRGLASMFLAREGAGLVAVLPSGHLGRRHHEATSAESRRTLRWLLLAIPPDLLCAAAGTGDEAMDLALTNPVIDRMLNLGGFAELHLHLGAAVDFSTIWHALVSQLGDADFEPNTFESPGAELDEGRELAQWVLRAGVMRLMLASYVRSNRANETPQSWATHRAIFVRRLDEGYQAAAHTLLPIIERELRQGQLSSTSDWTFRAIQELYRAIGRHLGAYPPETANCLADIEHLDPMTSYFPIPRGYRTRHGEARRTRVRSAEQRFVGRGIAHLEDQRRLWPRANHRRDPLQKQHRISVAERQAHADLARLFWQVVRIRCLVYRHIVQRPLTPGLQWFIRFFARARPARRVLPMRAKLDSAADLDGAGRGLRSLEVRTSPEATLAGTLELAKTTQEWCHGETPDPGAHLELIRARMQVSAERQRERYRRDGLAAVLEARRHDPDRNRRRPVDGTRTGQAGEQPLEVGVVLHFVKDRGGGTMAGLPSGHWAGTNADPDPGDPRYRSNATGYRYASFYLAKRREAVALARTLQRWPRTLDVIRGLDVCTDELGVPAWVMRPILQRVRDAAALAGRATEHLGQGPSPILRSTVHAGEDFVHLATGLRAVDEAIEQLGLSEGDRIGHAIALGVDPKDWAYRVGRVAIPREVRMWDLSWEWTWIASRGGGSVPRHAFLERELARLTERCWGQTVEPYELELLRCDLNDTAQLWRVGFPYGDRTPRFDPANRPERLWRLYNYLTNPTWFQEGRRVEWIDPSDEAVALQHLQAGLRDKVANLGLTIEINPTSNLLIGDLGSLTNHPMWRLDPPLPTDESIRPVAVAVGSDDPLMFGSSLVDEYNILYDGLMEANLTDTQARDWLERVRRRGLEARFTLPPSSVGRAVEFPNPLRDYPTQLI